MNRSTILQQTSSAAANEGDAAASSAPAGTIPWSSSPLRIRPARTSNKPSQQPLFRTNLDSIPGTPPKAPPCLRSPARPPPSSSASSVDLFDSFGPMSDSAFAELTAFDAPRPPAPVPVPAPRTLPIPTAPTPVTIESPLLSPIPAPEPAPEVALTGAQRRRLAMLGTLAPPPGSSQTGQVEPLTFRRVVSDPHPYLPGLSASTTSSHVPLPSTSAQSPSTDDMLLRKRSSPRPNNAPGSLPPQKKAKTSIPDGSVEATSSPSSTPRRTTRSSTAMARSFSVGSVPLPVAEAAAAASEEEEEIPRKSKGKEREKGTKSAAAAAAKKARASKPLPWETDVSAQNIAKRKAHLASLAHNPKKPNPLNTSTALSIKAKVVLSPEQQQILKMVVQDGTSLFFTGSAGTGKSVLLREIISSLRAKHSSSSEAVAVTASTGLAGCNIGGSTLHSYAGIGLGTASAEELARKVRRNKKVLVRWGKVKVWIIDEVSMVDADLFDKLSQVGSILRKDPRPFGGIQMIVTGDFFQLPPVTKGGAQPRFAFEANAWAKCISRTVNLTQVFRQKDQVFVNMLNEMRFGTLTSSSISKFKSLSRPVDYSDGLEPTELFPLRGEVDRSNQGRLKKIGTESRIFRALDGGAITDKDHRDKLLSYMMAPEALELKVSSQVMLIKNIDETLVNGSIGRVLSFQTASEYQDYRRGLLVAKSSDTADSKAITTATTAPETGKKVAKAEKDWLKWPIVSFSIPGGGKREVQVVQETFKVESPSGEVQASRMQIPLVLAWAMSIHKSQGQTLERVRVDLSRIFEKGQAYVALSRATSMDSLQVLGFDPMKVQCHAKVKVWSQGLESLR